MTRGRFWSLGGLLGTYTGVRQAIEAPFFREVVARFGEETFSGFSRGLEVFWTNGHPDGSHCCLKKADFPQGLCRKPTWKSEWMEGRN